MPNADFTRVVARHEHILPDQDGYDVWTSIRRGLLDRPRIVFWSRSEMRNAIRTADRRLKRLALTVA